MKKEENQYSETKSLKMWIIRERTCFVQLWNYL